jgi:Fur family peroxide stress response transcriptional regulator
MARRLHDWLKDSKGIPRFRARFGAYFYLELFLITLRGHVSARFPAMIHRSSNSPRHSAAALPAAALALGPEFRLTKQRREVYDVLREELDHPTASEVYIRAKARVPGISLATVYNCLETLTQSGLVKQVNLDRGPSRFCPNLKEHGHFHCEKCGSVTDIELLGAPGAALALPPGTVVNRLEISLRGICPRCSKTSKRGRSKSKNTLGRA